VIGLVAATWPSGHAFAQGAGTDRSAHLFDEGLKDMLAEHYDVGCPKLAESYKLEPLAGALFTLAECEAKWSKPARALRHYEQYLKEYHGMTKELQQKQRERPKVAEEQVKALSAQIARLTIVLPAPAPADAVVRLDGEVLDKTAMGVAQPVGPGEHQITFECAGCSPHDQKITLVAGDTRELKLGSPSDGQSSADAGTRSPASGGLSLQQWGYIVGGVGAAFLIIGIGTGAAALGKKGVVDVHCDGSACDATGIDAVHSGKTLGDVSTAGFVIGLAGLAAGVVLWVVGADAESPSPQATGVWPAIGSAPADAGSVVLKLQGAW